MLTHIQVLNLDRTIRTTIPVYNPSPDSPYVVKDVAGLGPVKASIFRDSYAAQDGAGYVSSKTEERNPIISLKYNTRAAVGKSVQTLRRELYRIFPTNQQLIIRFLSDDFVPVQCTVWVETHDPVMFAQEPTVQIGTLALQPHLEGQNAKSIPLEHDPTKPTLNSSLYSRIRNDGDIETGMLYGFFLSSSAPDLSTDTNILFDNLYPDGRRSVIVINSDRIRQIMGTKLIAGDTIYLESRPGHRGVSLVRAGLWYNIIGAIRNAGDVVETQWSSLAPNIAGDNLINYSVTGTNGLAGFRASSAAATYTPLYEGI